MKSKSLKPVKSMEPHQQEDDQEELADKNFTLNSDLCQQLMNRYAASSASQHRHLVATAAAMRSIIVSESLPLTPTAYFAASISAISNPSHALDSDAVSALTAFMGIALSLIEPRGIGSDKAVEAINVLVDLVEIGGCELVSTASVRSVVKCLGVLVGFCDLENWESVKFGLETLLKFSVDKRPKVRRCSQVCVETVFKSFQDTIVVKEASKSVLSFLRKYLPLAVELSTSNTENESKYGTPLKPDNLEVLHMLNVLTTIVPFLSLKISSTILSEIQKLMTSHYSELTRHLFKIIEILLEVSKEDMSISELETLVLSLSSYVSLKERNPMDSVISAANLLKIAFEKLHCRKPESSIKHLPSVIGSITGTLSYEASNTDQASSNLKYLINTCIDQQVLSTIQQPFEDEGKKSNVINVIKATCVIYENAISTCVGIPNEHLLDVISFLFLKLGTVSCFFMESIVLKLTNMNTLAGEDLSNTKHLHTCIGSAVIAMGPEKILELVPITLNAENFTCSNIGLIPILKNYVVGASLAYYVDHIAPLAKSFQRASRTVKKSVVRKNLLAVAHSLWGLLPTFCNYPSDTYQNVQPLIKLLMIHIKKYSFMHKNIAVSLQELVNQNKNALKGKHDDVELNGASELNVSISKFKDVKSYSKKTATKNIKALASCSTDLLQALTDLFISSPPEKRSFLKDAIGCLASISDSSISKKIFSLLLESFHLINDKGEFEKSTDEEQVSVAIVDNNEQRRVMLEVGSSFIEGAKEDLVNLIFDFVTHTFKETSEIYHREAYNTLSRILKEHVWFYSSRHADVIDLLLGLKSPDDISSLTSRFATFYVLMVQLVKGSEDEDTQAFLVLNEIILKLKDAKEEARKVAYDTLLAIGSSLRNPSCDNLEADAPYCKLISMIMGYLSGSSSQIKSGAVSALSVLVFQDANLCLTVPGLLPTMLHLLQNKAIEVIKAVLGFIKVLVSCLQAKDMQNLISDIVKGILPWSSVSRNHFKSKVTVILEIIMRKCGSAAVKFHAPEKYKNFVKTVLENRQTSSKEGSTTETEPTSHSSFKRGEKTVPKGLATDPQGKNDSFASRKRKREGNQQLRGSKNEKQAKIEPRSFRSKKAERTKVSNSDKAVSKPFNTTKVRKVSKFGKQRR